MNRCNFDECLSAVEGSKENDIALRMVNVVDGNSLQCPFRSRHVAGLHSALGSSEGAKCNCQHGVLQPRGAPLAAD